MSRIHSQLALIAAAAKFALAQHDGYTPLVSLDIPWEDKPYKIDEDASGRGPQYGYNNCSEETEGPDSLCQTGHFNSLQDFCLWGLPDPDSIVGDSEARAVAWCTQEGHGTRVMPPGTIKAAQWIQTESYVQVTGQLDQTKINIAEDDAGGEMDPAGEDARGNPLGGLLYTTAFGASEDSPQQVIWWTNFIGSGFFCMKACVPGSENETRNCEHVYDRVGCFVNMPSDGYFNDGVMETCEGDVGLPVGVYSGENGELSTWYQPPVGEEIGELPYDTASLIPASSQCSTPSSLVAALQPNATESDTSSTSDSSSRSESSDEESTASSTSSVDEATTTGEPQEQSNEDADSSASTVSIAGLGAGLVFATAALLTVTL